jgi:hypothetical protein
VRIDWFSVDVSGSEGKKLTTVSCDRYDVEVGYTQGVAFIVAALLLNMPDEEAFCVLVRLMESVSSLFERKMYN